MTDPVIRAAAVEDARAIAEAHVASWRAAYADILGLDDDWATPARIEERERTWTERIPLVTDEGHRTWVAEVGGQVAGFAFTRPTNDDDLNPLEVAELEALYLAPPYFGSGVGKRLLDRSISGMRSQGFLQATLWVLEENLRAMHFYRREGWRPDGARSACFRVMNAPAVRFRLPL